MGGEVAVNQLMTAADQWVGSFDSMTAASHAAAVASRPLQSWGGKMANQQHKHQKN